MLEVVSSAAPEAPHRGCGPPTKSLTDQMRRKVARLPTDEDRATAQGSLGADAAADWSSEGNGREPAGVATPPAGTVEGQQRSPQVTWLVMGRLHGGEAGSGARHDLEGRSEVARADEPGLTKYLNATELGIGSVRDPLSLNLCGCVLQR